MTAFVLVYGWICVCVGVWAAARTVSDWRKYRDRGFLRYGMGAAMMSFSVLGIALWEVLK